MKRLSGISTFLRLALALAVSTGFTVVARADDLLRDQPTNVFYNCWSYYKFKSDKSYKTRVVKERDPDFLDDHDFLDEKRSQSLYGKLATHYDPELQTRMFYTVTGPAEKDGTVAPVDKRGRALYIYLHGSGTQKASGVNFSYKMNTLSSMGYSTLSFDLPFHRDGSINPALSNTKKFHEWLNTLIEKYRVPGQPVYLVGHSFGPDLAAEYMKRYPKSVDGAALISPASFNTELKDWYNNHTQKMANFWGETKANEKGGRWAALVTGESTWHNKPSELSPDPTVVNPNLKIRVLTGDLEEYVPGELDERGLPTKKPRNYDLCEAIKKYLSHVDCTLEEGVGHYIFLHKDKEGNDVILRELLALDGKKMSEVAALKKEAGARPLTDMDTLAQRYTKEPIFAKWVDERYGQGMLAKILATQDIKAAREMAKDFKNVWNQREAVLYKHIADTKEWAPAFYAANEAEILDMGPKSKTIDTLVTKYFEFLETVPPAVRSVFARAPEDVKIPPAPKAIPDWVKNGEARPQGQQKIKQRVPAAAPVEAAPVPDFEFPTPAETAPPPDLLPTGNEVPAPL